MGRELIHRRPETPPDQQKRRRYKIGPRLTFKLRSLELSVAKEFGEHSTKLEFDDPYDIAADGGRFEGKNQPPAEEVDEARKREDDVEGEGLESEPGKETKPPTLGEYGLR